MHYNASVNPSARDRSVPATSEGPANRANASLRGLSYEAGRAALAPPRAGEPVVQRVTSNGANAGWQGRLTPEAEAVATEYNRSRGFSRVMVKRYQSAVRTQDDGFFGSNTAEAVARFQEEAGLTVDGQIGPKTQEAIEAQMERMAPAESAAEPAAGSAAGGEEMITSGQLSANFGLSEFASKDGAATPASVIPALRDLASQLEVVREAFGGASISITSGYRSPQHNRRVGGATRSRHMAGEAADFNVSGVSPRTVQDKVEELIAEGKMKQGGLGRYSGFTHYDIRGYRARF